MSVTGSPGSFVAFDNSGSGGVEDLASEVVEYFVAVCLEHSAEIVFDGHHPSPPLFFQMGQLGPHSHFSAFGATVALGVACSWVCGSIFMGGFEVIAGGMGQSFLNSKRFPDIFPALGHGVPA